MASQDVTSSADNMDLCDRIQESFPRSRGAIYESRVCDLDSRSEKRIRQMTSAIRAKDQWMEKLKNPEIRNRWSEEAKQASLTDAELAYALDELDYYASLHPPGSNTFLSPVENVWYSDSLVDEDTERELKKYTAIMEDVPESAKDWHPGSNEQVLNLIHPSLYPLVYERTRVMKEPIASPKEALDCGTLGEVPGSIQKLNDFVCEHFKDASDPKRSQYHVLGPAGSEIPRGFSTSTKFCWLPSEFRVDANGKTTIDSYINNLHPIKHASFYPVVANIFSRFVPLLEQVLTDLVHPIGRRVDTNCSWYSEEEFEFEGSDDDDYSNKYEEWQENRNFYEPQPGVFEAPKRPLVPYSLQGRRLQAIVKMSSIVLTPEKPEYTGGSWHVEALTTGLYYYDVENITESNLAFREAVDPILLDYEQGDSRGLSMVYDMFEDGVDDFVPVSQPLGQIEAKNGRCVVFPNTYQHRVSGFKLADPTKPGHRKIFAFFFIDPSTRIPSTEIVPPQQLSWWTGSKTNYAGLANTFPSIVQDIIIDNLDFLITEEQAKTIRLDLMDERKNRAAGIDEDLFEPGFSFCEH
ncbi:hypothetical protein GGI07_003974 [Coemansia sp. Benny D115]|nr:hypothetical protein GGI07_003974 [Coemansia sp. Benny D115]